MKFFSLPLILVIVIFLPQLIDAAYWSPYPFTIGDFARRSKEAKILLSCTNLPPDTPVSFTVLLKAHYGLIKEYSLFIELEEAVIGKRPVENSDLKRHLRLLGFMRISKYSTNIGLIGALTWYWVRESQKLVKFPVIDSRALLKAHSMIHHQIGINEMIYWNLANKN